MRFALTTYSLQGNRSKLTELHSHNFVWGRKDLNPRHRDLESRALSQAELRPQSCRSVSPTGLEKPVFSMFTYQPPYYEIEVVFKPKNVPSYKASEFREVSFKVDSEKSREEYFNIARQKAVSDDVVSEYGLKY